MIPEFSGIVLAGGRSSRFGSDKAFAPWLERPMILHMLETLRPLFPALLVVTKRPSGYEALSPRALVVEDDLPESHPLVGILSGLSRSGSEYGFVCACDMPLLQGPLVEALCSAARGYDAALCLWEGRLQPLCAVYSRACLEPIRKLAAEGGGIHDLFRQVRTRLFTQAEAALADPEGLSFLDIDTPEDFRKAEALCHGSR